MMRHTDTPRARKVQRKTNRFPEKPARFTALLQELALEAAVLTKTNADLMRALELAHRGAPNDAECFVQQAGPSIFPDGQSTLGLAGHADDVPVPPATESIASSPVRGASSSTEPTTLFVDGKKTPEADVETLSQRLMANMGSGWFVGQGQDTKQTPQIPLWRQHRMDLTDFAKEPSRAEYWHAFGAMIVQSAAFEIFIALLIAFNAIIMCFEIQYASFDLANEMNYTDHGRPSEDTWPGAGEAFKIMSISFSTIFALEAVAKVFFTGRTYFRSLWNLFDGVLVVMWVIYLGLRAMPINPTVFRVVRLLRVVRLTRVLTGLEAFDSLHVLMGAILACRSVLMWSACVLGFVMLVMGIFMNAMLASSMEADGEHSLATRHTLFEYFGSFTRCMYTMFEITTGNFIPVTRFLCENIDERYAVLLILYRFVVGFAMIKVIAGVFMHETFCVAASDDDLMVVQKTRAMNRHVEKMQLLIRHLDTSADGKIDRNEFMMVMEDKRLKTWLASMEVEVGNLNLLFDILDNGDGKITLSELVRGMARLKGPARSIDLVCVSVRCQELRERIVRVEHQLTDQLVQIVDI
eukprot:NODE_3608_length_2011_cov_11.580679.p1 GENE.NODE_3608_length_2011_cov_11.580679~~NODE_3608_length_2011_cov_11.580679.p1  ORF type:complete len:580 (-),score=123.24 NODE_3608_length_2011_cov_11.580679:270-2009(-)